MSVKTFPARRSEKFSHICPRDRTGFNASDSTRPEIYKKKKQKNGKKRKREINWNFPGYIVTPFSGSESAGSARKSRFKFLEQ